jgi:hypothetical protein
MIKNQRMLIFSIFGSVTSCIPKFDGTYVKYVHDKRKADEAFNEDTNDTTKSNPNKVVKSDHAIGDDDRALVENCSNRVSNDLDTIKSISTESQVGSSLAPSTSTSTSNTQLESILKNIESERDKLLERIDQVEDENNPGLYDYLQNSLVNLDHTLKSNQHTKEYFDLEAESSPKSTSSTPEDSDDDVPSMFDDFDF